MSPEVSVVICAKNEEHRLPRQLAALDRQQGAPEFEVIVVDDGSTDRTREIALSWIAAGGHACSRARVVPGGEDGGIPAARNRGALAAQGRVLAFCDADDEVRPGWVAALAAAAREGTVLGGMVVPRAVAGANPARLAARTLTPTSYLPHVSGCNTALLLRDYLTLGGCDESLPRYGFEDVEFSWRAQESGFLLVGVDDAVVDYTLSSSRASVRKRFLLGQGRVLMARRFPRYDGATYTLRSTLAELLRALRGAVVGSARSRRPDRKALSHVVACAGRVVGAVRHPARRPAPPPRLIPGSAA